MAFLANNPTQHRLDELVSKVLRGEWRLAAFQRPQTWKWQQEKQLLVSLQKGVPIGSVMTWKYNRPEPQHNRNFKGLPGKPKVDIEALVVDGQQRLTFLAWLFAKSQDARFPGYPFELYYEVSENTFVRLNEPEGPRQHNIEKGMVSLSVVLNEGPAAFIEIKRIHGEEAYEKVNSLWTAFKLVTIPVVELRQDLEPPLALFIFNLVNSAGTKLNTKDFAEAALTSIWSEFHKEVTKLVDSLALHEGVVRFARVFDRTVVLKCVLHAIWQTTRSKPTGMEVLTASTYGPDKRELTPSKIRTEFKKVRDAMTHLKQLLVAELHLQDDQGMSKNSIVPAVAYLSKNHAPTEEDTGRLLSWIARVNMFNHYSGGSTDRKVDQDCKAASGTAPWRDLDDNMRLALRLDDDNKRHRVVRPEDFGGLDGEPLGHHRWLMKLQRAVALWHGATDLVQNTSLRVEPKAQLHHIFPKGILGNHAAVDHLANMALLAPRSNQRIKDKEPAQYFRYYLPSNPHAFAAQQIPTEDEAILVTSHFEKFLAERSKRLAIAISDFLKALEAGTWRRLQETPKPPTTQEIIAGGEAPNVEFKQTFLVNVGTGKPDKAMELAVAKAVCSFMNSGGGTLVIGVHDSRGVVGLDDDLALIKTKRPDQGAEDQFLLQLGQKLAATLTKRAVRLYVAPYIRIETVSEKRICVLQVRGSIQEESVRISKNERIAYFRMGVQSIPKSEFEDS